jgi:predicted dehydrogenase
VRFSDINAGVVGVGFIGVAHVEALRRLGVNVAGVVGSTPERAQAKADAANLPQVYDSVEALAADPAIDAIHIATPNNLHAKQVRAVLDAGKHVICEKPLGLNSTETKDLMKRAAAAGVVNAVCFNIRFYPNCHQARALVADGTVGEPRFISGSYLQDWLLRDTDWNWRLVPGEAGELRAVADIGSHWLDLVSFVSGRKIDSVMADLHTLVPVRRHPAGPVETFAAVEENAELVEEPMSSDDAAGILLRFAGGARGVLAVSQVSAGRKNSVTFEVDGADASVAWYSEDPDRLFIGHRGRANEILQRDPALAAPEAAALIGYPGGHVEGYPDTFRALFGQVYADIARGGPAATPAYPTFADGHDIVLVTEAIARSARQGSWVEVERGDNS